MRSATGAVGAAVVVEWLSIMRNATARWHDIVLHSASVPARRRSTMHWCHRWINVGTRMGAMWTRRTTMVRLNQEGAWWW